MRQLVGTFPDPSSMWSYTEELSLGESQCAWQDKEFIVSVSRRGQIPDDFSISVTALKYFVNHISHASQLNICVNNAKLIWYGPFSLSLSLFSWFIFSHLETEFTVGAERLIDWLIIMSTKPPYSAWISVRLYCISIWKTFFQKLYWGKTSSATAFSQNVIL